MKAEILKIPLEEEDKNNDPTVRVMDPPDINATEENVEQLASNHKPPPDAGFDQNITIRQEDVFGSKMKVEEIGEIQEDGIIEYKSK